MHGERLAVEAAAHLCQVAVGFASAAAQRLLAAAVSSRAGRQLQHHLLRLDQNPQRTALRVREEGREGQLGWEASPCASPCKPPCKLTTIPSAPSHAPGQRVCVDPPPPAPHAPTGCFGTSRAR